MPNGKAIQSIITKTNPIKSPFNNFFFTSSVYLLKICPHYKANQVIIYNIEAEASEGV